MHMNRLRLTALMVLVMTALAGCGWFGAKPPAPSQAQDPNAAVAPDDPFAAGVLNTVAERAPPESVTQYLADLAAQFGWEDQVAQNALLKQAVLEGDYDEQVEPFLLSLYFRNGFSVLPAVGEGHEFSRDTVVRGAVASSRLLVTNRNLVRIIFLSQVDNIQIVYPQDGEQPQVFVINAQAVVAVRQSLLKQYLR